MKTIVLATDFSDSSKDAARYGFALACAIRAKVIIVNAMIIAAELPQSIMVSWTDEEFNELLHDYETALQSFKTELEAQVKPGSFCSPLACVNDVGRLTNVIRKVNAENKADVVVIGTHHGGLLSRLLIGNHANQLMDSAIAPLLIVKPGTAFHAVRKIAFASDFNNPTQDFEIIYRLITIAKPLNAEVLLTHVSNQSEMAENLRKTLSDYLTELSNKADYPNIYYRLIRNDRTDEGLGWLCEHGQIDMLAMAHHSRNILAECFSNSYTKKMNDLSGLPLLVFPVN